MESNNLISISSPKQYKYTYVKNKAQETMETFLYKFELPFILFLYATAFDSQEMLDNLTKVYIHKHSFFNQYGNWIYTLTPSDLKRFKDVLLVALNKFRYGDFDKYEDGFSIFMFLCVHPRLLPSLKILVERGIYKNLDEKDIYGNTGLMWANFYKLDETCGFLSKSGASVDVVNKYNIGLEDFPKKFKISTK